VLSGRRFINDFLLPKFDKINRMVEVRVGHIGADVMVSGWFFRLDRNITVTVGEGVRSMAREAGDEQYRFKPSGHQGDRYGSVTSDREFGTLPNDHLQWYWNFSDYRRNPPQRDKGRLGFEVKHLGEVESRILRTPAAHSRLGQRRRPANPIAFLV
jgi:hypothetical protein